MILITGSLAFDFIMNFPGKFSDHILPDKIHTISVSFLLKNMRRERGGCAANIAYSLALLGGKKPACRQTRPVILGVLGRDGKEYKNWLKKRGIDVSLIKIIRSKGMPSAFIMTDSVDNQITGFYPGAMVHASSLKLPASSASDIQLAVIAPDDPKAMINFAKECQELNIPYMFDPGMQLPRLKNKDLKIGIRGARLVIGNDYEMSVIEKRVRRNASEDQIWITTLGEKGSVIDYNGKRIKIRPAKPKNTSDPTGAGDAYRAGFVYGYCRGLGLKTAGQLGSLCAVYTVEKYGTATHRFTKKEFEKRYKENFGEDIHLGGVRMHSCEVKAL